MTAFEIMLFWGNKYISSLQTVRIYFVFIRFYTKQRVIIVTIIKVRRRLIKRTTVCDVAGFIGIRCRRGLNYYDDVNVHTAKIANKSAFSPHLSGTDRFRICLFLNRYEKKKKKRRPSHVFPFFACGRDQLASATTRESAASELIARTIPAGRAARRGETARRAPGLIYFPGQSSSGGMGGGRDEFMCSSRITALDGRLAYESRRLITRGRETNASPARRVDGGSTLCRVTCVRRPFSNPFFV